MHDFVLYGIVMTVIPLLVVLLVTDDGLELAVPGLAACFLWVGTVDGLGMCDIFLAGSVLGMLLWM